MRNLIVAFGGNRVIGNANDLPWRGQMAEDMRHFQELTLRNSVIMGRKTYESIGRPLRGRVNVVVSRTITRLAGCIVVPSLDEALSKEIQSLTEENFVIGGESIYREALPHMQRLFVTEIDGDFTGDTFFPNIDPELWTPTNQQDHSADDKNAYDYKFITFERSDNE